MDFPASPVKSLHSAFVCRCHGRPVFHLNSHLVVLHNAGETEAEHVTVDVFIVIRLNASCRQNLSANCMMTIIRSALRAANDLPIRVEKISVGGHG